MASTTIYVRLVDENVDVWRPVTARSVAPNEYVILAGGYDPELERWAFQPGERVVGEWMEVGHGRVLAAVRLAGQSDT
jgi:hypothetical protein